MCKCVHSCKSTLCNNSVKNKNPKSLHVVHAQSVYVRVCACVCVCVCVCDEYGVQAIYITMQVCSCTCTLYVLWEYSARNKNPKSLQVVQAQSLCVCVCVCVCAHRCVHSCTCTLCKNSVQDKNLKSLQEVQAQSAKLTIQNSIILKCIKLKVSGCFLTWCTIGYCILYSKYASLQQQ